MAAPVNDDLLEELVRRIVSAVHPDRIILLGFPARGESETDSDIDILVVGPDGANRRETARTVYRHLLCFGIATDVVAATPELLKRYGSISAFVYNKALSDGRELYRAAMA